MAGSLITNCGPGPVAIGGGLAGSIGQDSECPNLEIYAHPCASIMNAGTYESSIKRSRPIDWIGGFGAHWGGSKDPAWSIFVLYNDMIVWIQIIYYFISFLLQTLPLNEPGSESCRVATARFGALVARLSKKLSVSHRMVST